LALTVCTASFAQAVAGMLGQRHDFSATHLGGATWWLSLETDRVVFGYRDGRPFLMAVAPETHGTHATDIGAIHVFYARQDDPLDLCERLAAK
jgi:hypothetical protein